MAHLVEMSKNNEIQQDFVMGLSTRQLKRRVRHLEEQLGTRLGALNSSAW